MSIIASVHYREGAPTSHLDINNGSVPETGFDWMGLFPPDAEDAVNGRQLPKLVQEERIGNRS